MSLLVTMGTLARIEVSGDPQEGLLPEVRQRLTGLEQTLSRFDPASEVSKLNSASGWLPLGADTYRVISAASEYSELTTGAFDITIGAASERWDQVLDAGAEYVAQYLTETVTAPAGPHRMELDADRRCKLATGTRIDLGGIAKGYAADQVRDLCLARGASGALVSIGTSSISLGGRHPSRERWRIGLRSPWQAVPGSLGYLELSSGAFSSSGVYEQAVTRGGEVYHHILDPRTGMPARSDLCAAGVHAADGMLAEACSTAFLVMGLEWAMDFCAGHDTVQAVFFTNDGRIAASEGARADLRLREGTQALLASLRQG